MASTFTAFLKFNKPSLGDAGWGTAVNGGFTDLVDQAITGFIEKAVTAAGPNALGSIADGASSDARNQFILLTGTLASPATLTVPVGTLTGSAGNNKLYFIKNTAGNSVTITNGGASTVVVPDGKSMMLRSTSTGVEEAMTHQFSLSLGTALAAPSGGTGQSSYAVGDLLYADTTTTLAKLASVAEGSVLRAKGVGTAPAWGQVDLTTDVTGVLPVANGGTGAATLAANNVLLGNGTSAVQEVAPGASGNLLTSNGATWASTAPPAKTLSAAVVTSSTTWTAPAGVTQVKISATGGGGGGAADAFGYAGGNGGAPGMCIAMISVTPGTTYTVTVGAGGAGSNSGLAGTAGTETWFGVDASTKLVSCTGGGGGQLSPSGAPGVNGTNGTATVTGTVLRSGAIASSGSLLNAVFGGFTIVSSNAAAQTWSVSSQYVPGALGKGEAAGASDAGGGVGGVIIIEYVG